MKRMLLTAVASSLLALALPGAASANHGKRHHGASHKRHAKRARLITFGTAGLAPASGPTTTTPTPTTPTTPAGEPAGTVKSFEKGVLTITLKDGTTVSGMVTEETRLECQSATPSPTTGDDDQGAGDDQSSPESGEHGATTAHAADHGQQGEDGGDDQGDEGGDGSQTSCTTAALVPNAVVGEAELKLGSAGAVWEKVQLLQ